MNESVLHLYCPAGWSFVAPNRVRAVLNGVEVSHALPPLLNAFSGERACARDSPSYLRAPFGESFTGDDFAEVVGRLFRVPVEFHDGEDG